MPLQCGELKCISSAMSSICTISGFHGWFPLLKTFEIKQKSLLWNDGESHKISNVMPYVSRLSEKGNLVKEIQHHGSVGFAP